MSKEKRDERQAERQAGRDERQAGRTDPEPPDIGRPGGPLQPEEPNPAFPELPYRPGAGMQDTFVSNFPYTGQIVVPQDASQESVDEPVYVQLAKNTGTGDFWGSVSEEPGDYSKKHIDTQSMSWHKQMQRGSVWYVNIDKSDAEVRIGITVKG